MEVNSSSNLEGAARLKSFHERFNALKQERSKSQDVTGLVQHDHGPNSTVVSQNNEGKDTKDELVERLTALSNHASRAKANQIAPDTNYDHSTKSEIGPSSTTDASNILADVSKADIVNLIDADFEQKGSVDGIPVVIE